MGDVANGTQVDTAETTNEQQSGPRRRKPTTTTATTTTAATTATTAPTATATPATALNAKAPSPARSDDALRSAGSAEALSPARSEEALRSAGSAEAPRSAGTAEAPPPAGTAEAPPPARSAEASSPAGTAEAPRSASLARRSKPDDDQPDGPQPDGVDAIGDDDIAAVGEMRAKRTGPAERTKAEEHGGAIDDDRTAIDDDHTATDAATDADADRTLTDAATDADAERTATAAAANADGRRTATSVPTEAGKDLTSEPGEAGDRDGAGHRDGADGVSGYVAGDGADVRSSDRVRAHRRQRRQQRRRARRRRRIATALFAALPWSWMVLRERGGVWEFAAVVLPVGVPMAVFATACLAALFRRVGPLVVALSMAVLGVVTVLGPWRPASGGGPIIAGQELRVVSVNVAAQGGVELAEVVRNQDADVIVVAELSHGIDDALSLVYPYRQYSALALRPWTGRSLPPEERANQAGVGVYSRYPLEALADPTTLAQGLPGVRLRVDGPGGPLVLYGLHLTKASPNEDYPSVSYAVQRNVAGEVRAAVGREQEPVIVAGDLNLVDRQEAFRMFSAGLRDAMRADAWAGPTSAKLSRAWKALLLRIDHVLVTPGLCARDPERFVAPSSDHRGVAVTVGPCDVG